VFFFFSNQFLSIIFVSVLFFSLRFWAFKPQFFQIKLWMFLFDYKLGNQSSAWILFLFLFIYCGVPLCALVYTANRNCTKKISCCCFSFNKMSRLLLLLSFCLSIRRNCTVANCHKYTKCCALPYYLVYRVYYM
jgi:hypothetical protein